jgi:DNA modification methylase
MMKANPRTRPSAPVANPDPNRPTDADLKKANAAFAPVIQRRPIGELTVNPRNPRTHTDRQIHQIAASIREFGWLVPIVIDEAGVILAGHGRLAAARLLGATDVPAIEVKHLTAERKRAFALADNRLAELAGWDEELLRVELSELSTLELDFEIEITGFDTIDLDCLENRRPRKAPAPEVVAEPDRTRQPVSEPGDIWVLGPHRLMCGNALEKVCYERLMGSDRAQMAFTDPPYNVPIDGHVCGLGQVKHRSFAMAAGEMSRQDFTDFLTRAMTLMAWFSLDGSIHYVFMDWRHLVEVQLAGEKTYSELKNVCVWNKTNGGMGTMYRSKHELAFVFKMGTAPHINNFGLGQHGRYRTNVWDYAGVNTFKAGRMDELTAHPTVKPLPLVMDAIKDCSKRKGIILDPFSGSGTTILAAEKTGRVARALELDPHYVDVAIGRWQTLTGQAAVHLATRSTFAELAARRREDCDDGAGQDRAAS